MPLRNRLLLEALVLICTLLRVGADGARGCAAAGRWLARGWHVHVKEQI